MNTQEVKCDVCGTTGEMSVDDVGGGASMTLPDGWGFAGCTVLPESIVCSDKCRDSADKMHQEKLAVLRGSSSK